MTTGKLKLAQQIVESWPHARALAIRVDKVDEASATLSLPYDPRFIGDPETGVLHGGVISTLLDSTSGAAVILHPEFRPPTATIDLRIDYMRPATPDQRITATADVYHVTNTVAFIRAHAFDDDTSKPVATATGAFTFTRQKSVGTS